MKVQHLVATADMIIQSSGLQLEKSNLTITYDARGYKYIIPISLINEPDQYEAKEVIEVKPLQETDIKDFTIIIRTTIIPDCTIVIKNNLKISDLVAKYNEALISNKKETDKIRLFYGGKELKQEDQLYVHDVINGKVIQAFVMLKTK